MAILITILLVTFSSFGTTDKNLSEAQLRSALSKYQSISSLVVHFRQVKFLEELNLKLESTGILKVKFPNQITWQILTPSPLAFTLEGETIQITEGATQTQKINRSEIEKHSKQLEQLGMWLKLDAKAISTQYDVTESGQLAYTFTPKRPESSLFQSVVMNFSEEKNLKTLILSERSGDRIEIGFDRPHLVRTNAK